MVKTLGEDPVIFQRVVSRHLAVIGVEITDHVTDRYIRKKTNLMRVVFMHLIPESCILPENKQHI